MVRPEHFKKTIAGCEITMEAAIGMMFPHELAVKQIRDAARKKERKFEVLVRKGKMTDKYPTCPGLPLPNWLRMLEEVMLWSGN